MKLAIIGDEVSQDLEQVVSTVLEAGFTGIEVRSVGDVAPHELAADELARIGTRIRAAGLQVAGFCSPALKSPIPRTDHDLGRGRALVEHSMRQAEILGSPTVRIFTFHRDGDPDPTGAAAVAAELLTGVDLRGRRLLIETGMRTNTQSIRLLMRFLDRLGRDDVGILWDPGNSVFSGWEPDPFPADYELGRERIEHVHVKDPSGQREYVRLGDGDLPWGPLLDRLAADGYPGWLSLETHWRIGHVLSQSERDQPWGTGFSARAATASAQCMKILRDLVPVP